MKIFATIFIVCLFSFLGKQDQANAKNIYLATRQADDSAESVGQIPKPREVISALHAWWSDQDSKNLSAIKYRLDTLKHNCSTSSPCMLGDRICYEGVRRRCETLSDFDQNAIDNFHSMASEWLVTKVLETKNYEGNVISYVELRKKGTDKTGHAKIFMKRANNVWVVEDVAYFQ